MVYPQNEHDDVNLLVMMEKYVTRVPGRGAGRLTARASTVLNPPVTVDPGSARCGDINCQETHFARQRH
jgi:hypothetical protein